MTFMCMTKLTDEDIAIVRSIKKRTGHYPMSDMDGTANVADRHEYSLSMTLHRVGCHETWFGTPKHCHLATGELI